MGSPEACPYAFFVIAKPVRRLVVTIRFPLSSNTVVNLLADSGFENGTNWTSAHNGASTVTTTAKYLGYRSLQISRGAVRSAGFTVKPGETYTFSGYVKVSSSTATIGIGDADSENAKWSPTTSSNEWTRLQVSYTNNTGADRTVYALFQGTAAYLDCVQFERQPTASRYNLIENGDFATSSEWTRSNLETADGVTAAPVTSPVLSSNAYKITGKYDAEKTIKQVIPVMGSAGDSFVFGGWAMGNSASLMTLDNGVEKDFALRCTIQYISGETQVETVHFNQDVTTWQFVSWAVAAEKNYSSVTLEAVYKNNANTVYFDGLQLFKEEFGTSYTYDDDGNVISVIDLQNKNTTYEYANNDLTKIIQDGKEKMSYTYDKYHNVETATTEEGYVYSFEYDDYGNNTSVSITEKTENEVKKTITSSATYTSDHNHMATATDALGNVTTYGYNLQTGLLDWVQFPEDTEATRTEYQYDAMYRTASIAADLYKGETDTGLDMSVGYTYTDDLLTAITTPTTTYSFGYGNFSLRESVKVGSRTLASYHYDNKNRLESLDYGNGDKVEYSYDPQGRLLKETYEDGETVSYAYDNSGNLATVTDSETGTVTTYYYDLLNRNVGYREQGTNLDHSVTYIYDEENNLSSMTEVINGTSKTYTYTYNEDNRLTSMTVDGVTVEYTYDTFGRLSKQETKLGDTVILTEQTGYNDTDATASNQVTSYNGFTYTYDKNGNILSISDGTNTTSYVYDSQNQLIRENNQAKNFTKVWTYDNAGNILSRKEYAYTTVANLQNVTPTDTVSYGYEDDKGWGDLLTSYDGREFEYDTIGNLTNDQEWTYSWKNGRQLESMSDGNTTWTYTYDANGMRTGRTNGETTYTYIYNGNQLAQMIWSTPDSSVTINYTYDASGIPLSMKVGNTIYYYTTNMQGDVTGIMTASSVTMVNYSYDAWGNVTAIGPVYLQNCNPLTYRSYVYDQETELYYLQSRYYDPELGRFINADGLVTTGQGLIGNNMFAYCNNNPVMGYDPTGYCALWNGVKKAWNGFKRFVEETFGFGVVQSQSYETISLDTVIFGYESGISDTAVIAGDTSKPVSIYAQNASDWWKLGEYKVGVQINTKNGGISYSTNTIERSFVVSHNNKSTEVMWGLNKIGFTRSFGVDFPTHTAESYYHGYIRPVTTAFAVAVAVAGVYYLSTIIPATAAGLAFA